MRITIVLVLLSAFVSSCVTLPKNMQGKDEIIATGPGPEDMVIDTVTEQPHLLLSCNARRKTEPYYAEINAYYPRSGEVKVLKRMNEPSDLTFNPHGIDLVQVRDSLILLVVNHEHEPNVNAILRYQVTPQGLVFLSKLTDPLISSPNAVTGFGDGTMLISNDAKKQGNFWEPLLKLKRAQIIYWNGTSCSVASEKYCYSNGITNRNGKVYLASTRQNKVWQFDFVHGKMINREVLAKVHGADNLRFAGDDLLVACHLRFIDFLKHFKDSTHYSPTTVYRIHPATHKTEVVYFDSGAQLSAGSTALSYGGYLYVSGVFDPKIVRRKE